MKRFYTMVSTSEAAGGFTITLDGRPVKTPMKTTLLAPTKKLADALASEWAEQGEAIIPDSMPLTQILSTQLDRIANEREVIEATLLKYLDTDLLCYRADAPPALEAAQEKAWDKHLNWFADALGAQLETTTGLVALTQSEAAHTAATAHVKSLDDARFTLLQLVSSIAGSLVLGLAFVAGKTNADEVFAATHIEENFKAEIYNEEFYGKDPAQETKDKAALLELKAAQNYLSLI